MDTEISKETSPGRWLLAGPAATVFVSNFCVMALELAAGRIIARQLGSSLYTWTSVIGVVLSGITLGYYIGGRIADRFKAVKSLPVLFVLCSISCVITIIASNLIPLWPWLWQFGWVLRVFLHVFFIFMLPSTLLGIISPVVAKAALEKGLATGRTIGDIYAWGAAGSIAGTFAAGFYFIGLIGTIFVIWAVAGVMMLMALFYGAKLRLVRILTAVFLSTAVIGIGPWDWTNQAAYKLGLKYKTNEVILYEDETNYCYVAVKSLGGTPEKKIFVQDTLIHSSILTGEPNKLQYNYGQIMAAVTHRFAAGRDTPAFLVLGGGGYALPAYLERFWLAGTVDVVEIDPGVTKAAFAAFDLDPQTRINTFSLDGRNYVENLIEQKRRGSKIKQYDFIYEDAISDFSVPYQLTTKEFNDKLYQILADDGIYMVDLIDTLDSGLFLGTFINTIEKTFPFVTVISESDVAGNDRNTYVVVAAKNKIDLNDVSKGFDIENIIWHLTDSEIARFRQKSKDIVLTDDYAPVENLLAPVARTSAANGYAMLVQVKARKLAEQAQKLAWAGDLPATLAKIDGLARIDPSMSVRAYLVMANIFADTNRPDDAVKIYETATAKYGSDKSYAADLAQLCFDWAMLLQRTGKNEQANAKLEQSSDACKAALDRDPNSAALHSLAGEVFARLADFQKAAEHYAKAVRLDPQIVDNHFFLVKSLEIQGLLDQAIEQAKKSASYLLGINLSAEAENMRDYLQHLEQQKQLQK